MYKLKEKLLGIHSSPVNSKAQHRAARPDGRLAGFVDGFTGWFAALASLSDRLSAAKIGGPAC